MVWRTRERLAGLEDDLQDFADKKTVDGFELRLRGALVRWPRPVSNR